ncbi:hypothetical protein GCM10028796_21760 [Ramlibacter monticola]
MQLATTSLDSRVIPVLRKDGGIAALGATVPAEASATLASMRPLGVARGDRQMLGIHRTSSTRD